MRKIAKKIVRKIERKIVRKRNDLIKNILITIENIIKLSDIVYNIR